MTKSFRGVVTVLIGIALIGVGAKGAITSAFAKGPKSGPGHVLIGVEASTWVSGLPSGPGLIPIGGGGQLNGEFTIAERNGIQIGLRAQERFVGPSFMAVPNKNNKVGIYEAMAGFGVTTRATWNYDWHVDLRSAHGVAAGTTLADYDLTLETDIATSLFFFPVPVDLTFGGFIPDDTILYQSSQNPDFGNVEFDASVLGSYTFTLVLTPKTFNGPPLKVSIQVNAN